jgi:hypothetical protein
MSSIGLVFEPPVAVWPKLDLAVLRRRVVPAGPSGPSTPVDAAPSISKLSMTLGKRSQRKRIRFRIVRR